MEGAAIIDALTRFIEGVGFPAVLLLVMLALAGLHIWRDGREARQGDLPSPPLHQQVVRPETNCEIRQADAAEDIAKELRQMNTTLTELKAIIQMAAHARRDG